jgi:chromosome segregation ATPase
MMPTSWRTQYDEFHEITRASLKLRILTWLVSRFDRSSPQIEADEKIAELEERIEELEERLEAYRIGYIDREERAQHAEARVCELEAAHQEKAA